MQTETAKIIKNTSGADFLRTFQKFLLEFVFHEDIIERKPLIEDKDFILKMQNRVVIHSKIIVMIVVYLQWVLFYTLPLVYH
jgi:hypothetical protein